MENDIDSETYPGQGMYSAASLAREHAEHEMGAQYDDVRERYAAEMRDLEMFAQSEQEYWEYMQRVKDAGFGMDEDAYEAYRKTFIDKDPEIVQGANK
jgi:hypothetical protein